MKLVACLKGGRGLGEIFSDVKRSEWYFESVTAMASLGYMESDAHDGNFKPNDKVTKSQLSKIVRNISNAHDLGVEPDKTLTGDEYATRQELALETAKLYTAGQNTDIDSMDVSILKKFADKDKIADKYKKPIAFLAAGKLLNGTKEGFMNPETSATRAEVAALLSKAVLGTDTSKMYDYSEAVKNVTGKGVSQE